MAETIVSLGDENDDEIAFDETILQLLREDDVPIELLDETSQDNQFYSSDIENLLDEEDEVWLLAGSRQSDQQGANPLFSVIRDRLGATRQWQNGTVIQDRLRLQLKQNREPQSDQLGEAIAEAFFQNVCQYVEQNHINPKQYRMQLKLHLNGGEKNLWISSPVIPVEDWVNNRQRTRQWLETIANKLNSSQSIDLSKEDFFAEFLLFKTPTAGGRLKKYNIKSMSYEAMLRKKRCIITIRNKDDLCCARAIVTVKARVDGDSHYNNMRHGCPIQERLAKLLHQDADVPEQPCGRAELELFQTCLGPEYQLMVAEGMKGQIIYKNPAYDSAKHLITLLNIKEHYHGITSLPAFLNRSYFCRFCNRGYDHETAEQHNCQGQNCVACRRGKKQCTNFAVWVKPTHYCNECNRWFYGEDCFKAHKKGTKKTYSVCQSLKKCKTCCKVYKWNQVHECFKTKCGNCGEHKEIDHRCFIQPYKAKNTKEHEEEEKEEEEEESEDEDEGDEKPVPLIIAFDIECEAKEIEGTEDKMFEPVLIGWSILGEPDDYNEVTTISAFLKEMESLTEVEDKERDVYCFAHNLRAFDGMFIQEALYDQGQTIHSILNQGAKYLSFQCGNLIFRDSMNL